MVQWTNIWWPEIYEPRVSSIPGYTNPSCDVFAIDINDRYLEETLGEDLSAALVKNVWEVEEESAVMVVVKYQELQVDLGSILQGVQG